MSKTIKAFLILSFITATCWAYLFGEYMGTRISGGPGFQSVSFSHSTGSPGQASSTSSARFNAAMERDSGSSDSVTAQSNSGVTAQSNSGTSGKAGTGIPTIHLSKDGITLEYENGVKIDVKQNEGEGFVEAVTRTIGNNSDVINNVVAGVVAQNKNQNKVSALSVAAEAELEAGWLEYYMEWRKGLTAEQINETVSPMINAVAEKYFKGQKDAIPLARALLMEVDGIKVEQYRTEHPDSPLPSLIIRLKDLSIKDPLFAGAKENVLLQKAIAEAVPETSENGEEIRPMPIMNPSQRGDFKTNESRAGTYQVRDSNGDLRYLTPAEKREVAIIVHERSGQSGWLDIGGCPTLGGPFASVIQEVTGKSPMDPYGSVAYEADVSRFSNYYQVSEDQAKQAINLLLGDSIVGNEWVQRDPETGEVIVDYLEVGPETGVGYPICPIMSNDIQSYLNYVTGAGPRPEALTSKDIEEIILGSKTTEINIQNKAEELNNETGTNISEEMMILALGLAIVDKGLIVTDENIREVINSITLAEVEYYISMINKVAEKYNLTPSEAASVLKVHISNQRINNPNYKLSEENDIIKNIEANKSSSGLYIEILQDAKTGSISPVAIDLNCDGNINLADVAILLSFWNKNPSGFTSCQSPDINQDGSVNLTDFSIMMSYWNYAFK